MQVRSDDRMRLLGGVRNPTRQLFHVELAFTNRIQCEYLLLASTDLLGIEGEPTGRFVAELNGASCEIDGAAIQTARRACFESTYFETHFLQARAQG